MPPTDTGFPVRANVIGSEDLDRCPLLHGLSAPCLDKMAAACLEQRFPPGALVLTGAPALPHDVFAVLEGNLDVLVAVNGASGSCVGTIEEGEVFGFFSAVAETSSHTRVHAQADVRLAVVPRHVFLELVRTEAEIAYRLVGHLVRVIRSMNERLAIQTNKSDEVDRLYHTLLPHCL